MLFHLIVATTLLAAPPQPADTVVAVRPGTRLDVDDLRGEIIVRSWDRDAVGIRAELASRQRLEIDRGGAVLRIRPRRERGGPADTDLQIDVPRWMAVKIGGNQVDVEVAGTGAGVTVETVHGDITVDGGSGLVSLHSIQGDITVRNARGRVEAVTVNEDIRVTNTSGDIQVETTNGDVHLLRIRSSGVRATSLNGDVVYDGTINPDGRYVFTTHNGDVVIHVPRGTNATVGVTTYQGDFESDFPVRMTGSTGYRNFTFALGSGSARIELETFNGDINLRRP